MSTEEQIAEELAAERKTTKDAAEKAAEVLKSKKLKVYNGSLMRLGVVDVFRSLIWTRKYFEAGTFELHTAITEKNLKILKEDNIVTMSDSCESAFIEGVAADDYSNELTITGHMLSFGLSRRGIKTVVNFTGKTEAAMRTLVETAVILDTYPLPGVELGELKGYTNTVTFQVSYKDLYTFLCKLSKYSNLGFRLVANYKEKVMKFEVYEGVNRTEKATGVKRVIFSEVHKNLEKATYTMNNQNLKTHAIVYGDGEGTARTRVEATIGEGYTGWQRREVIVDAKDVQRDDLTNAQYLEALVQRGNDKLQEYGIVECLDAQTQPFINFSYKTDYDLGDIVTIDKKNWGIKVNKRITEIQEIYENGGYTIVPTFGDPLAESIDLSKD